MTTQIAIALYPDLTLLDAIGPYQVLRTLKEWDRIAVDDKRQAEDAMRLRRKRR